MKRLNLNGNNINEAAVLAISSCIGNIETLNGIEKIDHSTLLKLETTTLNEIVKKVDPPVIKK